VVTDGFDITGAKDPLLSKNRVDYAFLCCQDNTFSGSSVLVGKFEIVFCTHSNTSRLGVPGLRGEVHRSLQLQSKDIVGVQLEFLEDGQMATLSFFKNGVLICACLLPYVDQSAGFRPAVLGFGGRDISVRANELLIPLLYNKKQVRIVAYENRTPIHTQRLFY